MIQNATDVIAASAGAGPDASAAPVIKPVGRTPQPGRVFHGRGAGVRGELDRADRAARLPAGHPQACAGCGGQCGGGQSARSETCV